MGSRLDIHNCDGLVPGFLLLVLLHVWYRHPGRNHIQFIGRTSIQQKYEHVLVMDGCTQSHHKIRTDAEPDMLELGTGAD